MCSDCQNQSVDIGEKDHHADIRQLRWPSGIERLSLELQTRV